MIITCKICNSSENHPTYTGQEIRLGFGDTFTYFRCNHCGCLQIEKIPQNIQKYYENYHSLKNDKNKKEYLIKSILRKYLFKYRLNNKSFFGKILEKYSNEAFEWIEPNIFNFNSSILDVGAGYGRLLQKMARSGFSNLHGIDPFLENDLKYRIGKKILRIEKKEIYEVNCRYDVIMLHHVLEHMPDQNAVFEHLIKLMHTQSKLIILIPIMSEYIWRHFGMHGFQLADIPRHYYIHTYRSLSMLAEKYGLQLLCSKYFGNREILVSTMGEEVQELNKCSEDIVSSLIEKKDSGLACFYFIKANT